MSKFIVRKFYLSIIFFVNKCKIYCQKGYTRSYPMKNYRSVVPDKLHFLFRRLHHI